MLGHKHKTLDVGKIISLIYYVTYLVLIFVKLKEGSLLIPLCRFTSNLVELLTSFYKTPNALQKSQKWPWCNSKDSGMLVLYTAVVWSRHEAHSFVTLRVTRSNNGWSHFPVHEKNVLILLMEDNEDSVDWHRDRLLRLKISSCWSNWIALHVGSVNLKLHKQCIYFRTFLKQTKWYLRAIFKRVKKLIRDGIVFVIGLKLSPSSRPIKFKN